MTGRPRATNTNKPSGNMIRDSALGLVPETLDHYMAPQPENMGERTAQPRRD